jgi:hypothetical protein
MMAVHSRARKWKWLAISSVLLCLKVECRCPWSCPPSCTLNAQRILLKLDVRLFITLSLLLYRGGLGRCRGDIRSFHVTPPKTRGTEVHTSTRTSVLLSPYAPHILISSPIQFHLPPPYSPSSPLTHSGLHYTVYTVHFFIRTYRPLLQRPSLFCFLPCLPFNTANPFLIPPYQTILL